MVEATVKTAQDYLVTGFVQIFEIVGLSAVLVSVLDDDAMIHPLGQQETFISRFAREDLVGFAIINSDVRHPILTVILEMDNIGLQLFRTFEIFGFLLFFRFLFVLAGGNQHAVAGAFTIDGEALAAGFPCFHVEIGHCLLINAVRKIHRNRDGVVNPFLH